MSGYIIVSSVTYAYKGLNALERLGYRARIDKEPQRLRDCGCHYIIRPRGIDIEKAVDILRKAQVRMLGTGQDGD